MSFYCQLDYPHIPYPSPSSPNGNLADNGCGVCAACMIIEELTGKHYPPEEGAILAKACGAREGFGTDMAIFAPVFTREFGLAYEATLDTEKVLRFLQGKKGLVIANTVGDREGWTGVFSDSGHYVVIASAEGNTIGVWDPMLNPGRYDVPGRAGKVRLDGTTAYADFSVIVNDCEGRPYYLIYKDEQDSSKLI